MKINDTEPSRRNAAVGDAAAASSAAPIKKNFWRECAELEAMSATVRLLCLE